MHLHYLTTNFHKPRDTDNDKRVQKEPYVCVYYVSDISDHVFRFEMQGYIVKRMDGV